MLDIELINVTKTYPDSPYPAVNKMNLQAETGEIFTLIGPSGCGKTTTLRLIAGFETPERGKITLRGRVVAFEEVWVPPEKRGVGMVFQDYALFPHLTVEQNVAFGLRKAPNKSARTLEVLELVGLASCAARYPHELSGGQQQRVALARALAPDPVVILLDEPFSNLDSLLKKHMLQEIRDIIKSEGTTAIFVTHDQNEAFELSDKIAVINNGSIEQIGTPKDIYLNPANSFVAGFMGQTNVIGGTVKKGVIETEIGKLEHNLPAEFTEGSKLNVFIRPHGFKLDAEGDIRGSIKKIVFKGEIVEGIISVNRKNNDPKNIAVYFDPYEKVQCGDNVTLKIIPNSVIILK